ncbi:MULTISPECIES: TonB-dependent receptor [Brevundimonas]|uniref:TonB-dependent receptor n=1 Tax=Brevundimonas TaxID=41275 RepID=UPI00190789AE|nr:MULTISPECIES: TonB-dependent receptor [Brevundimonas]MBK1970261.1 TonB-dependent receptor [Brevundimonas diminuta]MBK1975896.1 TonB-dependent receptor [Brevundimonas diminuta]MDA0744687.1 TonB-dependent receptor [Pseudomonadota bacterium]MDM8352377.1 TonB-dependent receptor [Brevundimonas diminuta]
MNRLVKTALLAGAAFGVMASAAQAQAQDAPSTGEQASSVDDIIVSARRRDEALKDVPVSVSAMSAERLEQTGATDITALQQQTPNATVQVARGSNSTLISFIRGIGQQDPLWGFEPGVGLYVDDVYVARPQGAVLDIFDIERIEVLRGPQGSLYGRNTVGGAIKYVTSRLDPDMPELTLRGAYGSYNQIDLLAQGSMPVTDKLRIGAAVASYNRDGFGKNLNTGAEHYDKDVIAGRVSVEFQPYDNAFFRLAYDRVEDRSNPRHGHRERPGVGPGAGVPGSVYDTYAGLGDRNKVTTEGVSLTAQVDLNDVWTFKSITAYRTGDTDTLIDFDNTPAPTLDIPAVYGDHQFTQELQALFSTDRIQGVAGIFYLDGTASGAFDTIAQNFGIVIGTAGYVETTSVALFTDVNLDLTDRLHLGLGARYTIDDKTGHVFRANYLGATRSPLLGGTARNPILLRTDYTRSKSFDQFTPKVSLSYDFSDRITGYASYSKGYKSGGFDMRGDAILTPDTVNGYEPETVDSYEIGLKGSAFNRRLNFASAIFYNEYQDQQITTQVPAPGGIASFVDNVGASKFHGAEFEGSLILTDSLTANFAVGYLDSKFEKFIRYNLVTQQYEDISDLVVLQNAPKWTGYLGLTWQGQLAGGALAVTPSVSYRDDYSQFEYPNADLDQEAFALVDLSIVWTDPSNKWTVGLYGKNLTDEEYRVGGYNFAKTPVGDFYNDSVIGYYGPPRTVTASLQYKF